MQFWVALLRPCSHRDHVTSLHSYIFGKLFYVNGLVLLWTSPCSSPNVSVPLIWEFFSRSPQIFGTPQTSSNFHRFLRQLYKAPHQSIFYVLSHLQRLYRPTSPALSLFFLKKPAFLSRDLCALFVICHLWARLESTRAHDSKAQVLAERSHPGSLCNIFFCQVKFVYKF